MADVPNVVVSYEEFLQRRERRRRILAELVRQECDDRNAHEDRDRTARTAVLTGQHATRPQKPLP